MEIKHIDDDLQSVYGFNPIGADLALRIRCGQCGAHTRVGRRTTLKRFFKISGWDYLHRTGPGPQDVGPGYICPKCKNLKNETLPGEVIA